MIVVLGSRTIPNPVPPVYQKLTSLGVKEMHLGPLSEAEVSFYSFRCHFSYLLSCD